MWKAELLGNNSTYLSVGQVYWPSDWPVSQPVALGLQIDFVDQHINLIDPLGNFENHWPVDQLGTVEFKFLYQLTVASLSSSSPPLFCSSSQSVFPFSFFIALDPSLQSSFPFPYICPSVSHLILLPISRPRCCCSLLPPPNPALSLSHPNFPQFPKFFR